MMSKAICIAILAVVAISCVADARSLKGGDKHPVHKDEHDSSSAAAAAAAGGSAASAAAAGESAAAAAAAAAAPGMPAGFWYHNH